MLFFVQSGGSGAATAEELQEFLDNLTMLLDSMLLQFVDIFSFSLGAATALAFIAAAGIAWDK